MKMLIVSYNDAQIKKLIKEFCENIQSLQKEIVIDIISENQVISNRKVLDADLLITFNLAGFEHSTLTNGISYNLLKGKQIHFLMNRELINEKYLEKQLSISMFFFCLDDLYCRYLQEKYPDIPFLQSLELSVGADSLCAAVFMVIDMCKLENNP